MATCPQIQSLVFGGLCAPFLKGLKMTNRDKMRLLRQEAETKANTTLETLDKRVQKLEKGKAAAADENGSEAAENTENSAKKGKK